jgi:hypothetical protein
MTDVVKRNQPLCRMSTMSSMSLGPGYVYQRADIILLEYMNRP